jgi:hypothetical protein
MIISLLLVLGITGVAHTHVETHRNQHNHACRSMCCSVTGHRPYLLVYQIATMNRILIFVSLSKKVGD